MAYNWAGALSVIIQQATKICRHTFMIILKANGQDIRLFLATTDVATVYHKGMLFNNEFLYGKNVMNNITITRLVK